MAEIVTRPSVGLASVDRTVNAPPGTEVAPWSPWRRIGFRWLFGYLVLYMLQPSPLDFLAPGLVSPYSALWESIVKWTGTHLLGLTITVLPNASGDTTYNHVQVLCYALLAAVAAGVWTVVDRRLEYGRLHAWLRAAARVYLAAMMFLYGSVKVIKTQFPDLSPVTLNLPLGHFSPNSLLWTFMGASTLYTFYVGFIELLGGALLVSRRTTLLGSLVCMAVMSNVVMLNVSYDVVVKLFAVHLLAIAVFLAAPDARRLIDFLVRNRPVAAADFRPLVANPRGHRVLLRLRTGLLLGLLTLVVLQAAGRRQRSLAEVGRTPLCGAWRVEELTVEGAVREKAVPADWRRVVFDGRRQAAVELESGEWRRYDWFQLGRSIELLEGPDAEKRTVARLQIARPAPSRLELAGEIEGRPVVARLRRSDPEFILVNRGFHWINEWPVR